MALYYLLLRFWLLIGSTEGFIRGLSVLASVATLPLFLRAGQRACLDARPAWSRSGSLAINAFHIRYAQEARGYALVVFFHRC